MEVTVSVSGPDAADNLRSLLTWLSDEDELHGRIRLTGPGAQPGTLGSLTECIAMILGPGSMSAALAASLVAWLRQRTSDVAISVRNRHGEMLEMKTERVHGLNPLELRELMQHAAELLNDGAGPDEHRAAGQAFRQPE
jgi:hypothetical protein